VEALLGVHRARSVGIGGGVVVLNLKGSFLGFAVVPVPFKNKQKLPVRDPLYLGGSITKRRFQVALPEIIGLADVTIDINNPH
jgi:hypothetical protein